VERRSRYLLKKRHVIVGSSGARRETGDLRLLPAWIRCAPAPNLLRKLRISVGNQP
jgi:hypothetical protein